MCLYFPKILRPSIIAILVAIIPLTSSCLTPQKKKEMEDDIFRLQTRVLQLESNVATTRADDQKAGEVHHKTIATASSDLERINIDVKRMRGDIDALKVGVQTGQMPGQEGIQEGSIGAQLAEIRSRLDAIESQQRELASTGERGSSSKKPSEKREPGPQNSSNADSDSLKTAFDRKHYKEVVEDAPSVLKKSKGNDRINVLMLYGDSLMKLNRPKEAALQFNEIVDLKANDKQMSQAKLKLGDAFKALGDKETSRLFYDEVASKYAGTPEGDKAKKALKAKK